MVVRSSALVSLVEGLLTGADVNVDTIIRAIHEHTVSAYSVSSAEVLLLAFLVQQVCPCRVMRQSVQTKTLGPIAESERLHYSHGCSYACEVSRVPPIIGRVTVPCPLLLLLPTGFVSSADEMRPPFPDTGHRPPHEYNGYLIFI